METSSTKEPCASSATSSKSKGNEDVGAAKSRDNIDANETKSNSNGNSNPFECNICLDNATDPVVSLCGHLFCWPCLHEWLMTRPVNSVCPVCKSEISKEKVVPLYGRDGKQEDPRKKQVPPRPAGQRTEPPRNNFFGMGGNGGGGGGFQLSFGIGALPFTFFGSTFNFGGNQAQGPQNRQEEEVYHLFFWLAIFFLLWLVFL